MNCPEFGKLMMYLDGELDPSARDDVEAHLGSCRRCRKVLDSQRNLESAWREDFDLPDRADFDQLEEAVFRALRPRRRWMAVIPAAAGIMAVLLGLKLILVSGPSPESGARTVFSEDAMFHGGFRERAEHLREVDLPEAVEEETMADELEAVPAEMRDISSSPDPAGPSDNASAPAAVEEVSERFFATTAEEPDMAFGLVQEGQAAGGIGYGSDHDADTAEEPAGVIETVTVAVSRSVADDEFLQQAGREETFTLVFDAEGLPDSSTAVLLDSLLPGWEDYIPFENRDTVVTVPAAEAADIIGGW